jgi:prepilin-type N-terminal cleavage/methylation domain-containing protein
MFRHFWRACDREAGDGEAGFSFIELLVTIIIAGIAFAAIVPMFIQAQGKNSADLYRQAALNAAQDRIERVRALDFSSVTPANLPSALGTTAPVMANSAKTLAVSYSVTPKANTAMDNTPYKVVTVTVTWTAPPKPVKPVVVQTVVYRQYAGPTLGSFWTDPAVDEDGVLGNASLSIVKVNAIPTTAWKGQQTQSVQYQVWDAGGHLVTSQVVYNSSITAYATKNNGKPCGFDSSTSTFWWNWDSSGAIDGTYSVSATPASALTGSYQGPTERFFFKLSRNITVAAPTGLAITAGATQASLTWNAVTNATSYKVYRATSAGGPFSLVTTVSASTGSQYNDTGLASSTDYWYEVSSVSGSGGESARCAPVSVHTLVSSTDTTAPSVPTWASPAITHDVVAPGVIELRWNASTDAGTAGLADYRIWRSNDGSTGWTVIATWTNLTTLVYDDTVGDGATRYYRITARDAVLNESSPSSTQSATTDTSTSTYTLTITNTNNGASKDRYVWVQMVSTTQFYSIAGVASASPAATGTLVAAKSGTAIFTNMPNGVYNIWVSTTSPYNSASVQTSAQINYANLGVNIN